MGEGGYIPFSLPVFVLIHDLNKNLQMCVEAYLHHHISNSSASMAGFYGDILTYFGDFMTGVVIFSLAARLTIPLCLLVT